MIKIIYHKLIISCKYISKQVPMLGRSGKSATRKECRRKAACDHTCTATLTCKSIEIYIGKISRIKQLFDIYRNIHVNSYFINILIMDYRALSIISCKYISIKQLFDIKETCYFMIFTSLKRINFLISFIIPYLCIL